MPENLEFEDCVEHYYDGAVYSSRYLYDQIT